MEHVKIDDFEIKLTGSLMINKDGRLTINNCRFVEGFIQLNRNLIYLGEYIYN
jgi:hypothetical protein